MFLLRPVSRETSSLSLAMISFTFSPRGRLVILIMGSSLIISAWTGTPEARTKAHRTIQRENSFFRSTDPAVLLRLFILEPPRLIYWKWGQIYFSIQ